MSSHLFIISGPSGVGKNTVVEEVKKILPELEETVSATTRAPRTGEIDGTHYHFLTPAAFEEKVAQGYFLEHFNVHGNHYGTPRSEVERIATRGHLPLLVIDVQGGLRVKELLGEDAILIFIAPESLAALEVRIAERGANEENLAVRLRNAAAEMAAAERYDYTVINATGQVAATARQIAEIIKKHS